MNLKRTAHRGFLVALLIACIPASVMAQTDQTKEAPLQPPPANGVAIFGELVSISTGSLVLRESNYVYPANSRPGDGPELVVSERVIQIPEGTPILSANPDGLLPGAQVIVGARLEEGILIAVMISDAQELRGGRATEPEAVKSALAAPMARAMDEAVVSGDSTPAPPNCLIAANGFTPGADVLNFTGCYGGPSLTARASFSVKIFANGIPDSLIIPETFSISVTGFELNLGLAGWNYQLPFKFTAVDPAQVALDTWARECLARYGTVAVGGCPLVRPYVPGPGQPRNIEVNVTPVDPSPAPIMNGGLGGTIGFEFTLFYATGCGTTRLDPCYFKHWVDFGPFSQFQRANGAAPLGVGKVLRGEANSCLAVGGSLILGKKLPVGISTLLSPFDVLYCQPWALYNNSQPGFTARVSDAMGGTVTDVAGTENPRVTFTGLPRTVRLTPGNSGTASIRFQQFDYRLDWLTKLRLDLRSSLATWYRGPEWNTGITTGMKFVNTISPYIDTCGAGLVHELDARDFTGLQPVCIDIAIPQAEFGNASVKELNPVAVSPEGGTKVVVQGSGFLPTKKADGASYPGTGVTRIVLHRKDTNTQEDLTFTVRTDGQIDLTMPAHPPTLQVNEAGAIEQGSPVVLTFYAWGTTFNRYLYYAARPTVSHIIPIGGAFSPEGTRPTGSEMGGERVALTGSYIGKVTDVFFGDRKADFVECHAGQTSPLCDGAPGGWGLYNSIVAIAPFGTGALADCPAGQGTRCDYITVRSACFGNDFAQGRPAPGAYCGLSAASNNALYVRKKKPEITGVTPGGALPDTPMQITITGVGFAGYPRVRVADVVSDPICNAPGCPTSSDTRLVVTVPAAPAGATLISVINPCPAAIAPTTRCGESDPASFKHLDTPLVTSLSPAQGTYAGGTVVTLHGTGLTTVTALTFGGAPLAFTPDATSPDTKLTFITPLGYPNLVGGLPASVNVVVTASCGTEAYTNATACGTSAPLAYTYEPPAVRQSATLRVAQITGEVGRPAAISATLTDSVSAAPLPGRTIVFSVLGTSIGSAVTNASGVASLTAVMPDLRTGAYAEQTVAAFAGDAVYAGRTDVNWLILTKPEVVAWGTPMFAYYKDVPALLQGVTAIAAGGNHTLALKNDGTVVAWGNALYDITPPAGLSGVTSISAGYSHSLALKGDGTVVKWGIGGGTLPTLPAIQKISAGSNLSVAVTSTGSLVAWAHSPTNAALSNIPTPGADPFVAAAAGGSHGLALRQSGTVVAWGDNTYGQTTIPTGLTNVVAVAAAFNGSIALRSDGTVVGWGNAQPRTVCPPFPCTVVTESRFKPPTELANVIAIAASPDGSGGVALKSDKTVTAWSHGTTRNLNAPAGYAAGVESVAVGGESGVVFYVALRKARLGTTLTVDPVTGFAGDAVTLRGVLLTGTSGASDRDVTFSINGVAAGVGSKTDVNGVTTKAVTIPAIAPGVYPTAIQASFPTPTLGLDGSSATAQLLVRGNQTITLEAISDRTYDPSPLTVNATASSGLPVSLTASGDCTVASGLLTLLGSGTCSVTASQPGDSVYTAASAVTRSFSVTKASQTITFEPIANASFGRAPVTAVVSSTSGLPVLLTSLTPSVCSATGTRIMNLTRGTCSVAADQPGNAGYAAATRVVRTFSIALDAFDLLKLPSQLDPPSTTLAVGAEHTCSLLASGAVKCWGRNDEGQLGDGSTTRRTVAVDVFGLGASATDVAASGNRTCAVMAGGTAKCWGSNAYGELGNNSIESSSSPVTVQGISGVVALALGSHHSCALTTSGRVKCWGRNASGQLGNNSTQGSLTPVDVVASSGTGLLAGVIGIAAGAAHTCALSAGGEVSCWGGNTVGQLGGGSAGGSALMPVSVQGVGGTGKLSGIVRLAAGDDTTCAVSSAGAATCWGGNAAGQIGDGSTTDRPGPVAVGSTPRGIASITVGGGHVCVIDDADGVLCSGANGDGQLGDGSTIGRSVPTPAHALAYGLMKVAAGGRHTCALTTAGGVRCWGSNSAGQLGNSTTDSQATFVDVVGLSTGAARVAVGRNHACAISSGGGLKCWGRNVQGELGDGTTTSRLTPSDVTGLRSGVIAVAAGGAHTCALTVAGGVKCWGANAEGAVGDTSSVDKNVPTDVVGLASGVSGIVAGEAHTCAVLATGGVRCWGSNAFGQLGDGTQTNSAVPVGVTLPAGAAASLVAGDQHTCSLGVAGGIKCWGRNSSGQLGDGTTTSRSTPGPDVPGMGGAALALGAGGDHTCAVRSDNVVRCWGSNTAGQLGDGTQIQRSTPVDLASPLSGASVFALGSSSSCALDEGGQVFCWGANANGQLGDGTTVSRPVPAAPVTGIFGGGAVTGAQDNQCAITGAGGLRCWGRNGSGQIGDDTTVDRLAPAEVRGGQSIYFNPPSTLRRNEELALDAASTSGLAVTHETLTPAVCSVAGSTVKGLSQGVCSLRASQGGDGSRAAAPQRVHLVPVTPAVYLVSPSAGSNGSISPSSPVQVTEGGTTQFTVTPASGYTPVVGGTCGGSLSGTTFTVAAVNANCSASVSFEAVSISIGNATIAEGDSGTRDAVFAVNLSRQSSMSVTVSVRTANGTASDGADYQGVGPATVTFNPGETSRSVSVPVSGDVLDEADETFVVNLSSPSNATIATDGGAGTGTIADDDATPTVSIGNATVAEGNSGTATATFTVTLSPASGRVVTVAYATADGTAVAGSDYTSANGTLNFAAGETSKSVTIATAGDVLDEADETFTVNLSSPSNATIATDGGVGTGTITDDDATPTVSLGNATVAEGNSGTATATFTVTLSAASGRAVAVDFATANGSASAGSDYTSSTGTLSFAAGETSKTVTIATIGDVLDEADEMFTVNLSSPSNATIATDRGVGTGTITDDDPLPLVSIGNATVTEGNSGVSSAAFMVTLSAASGRAVSVDFATANGAALAGSDYTSSNGTLNFAAGETSKSVTIATAGDVLDEADETFTVSLFTATNATIQTDGGTGTGTITDDDPTPAVSIANAAVTEGHAGTSHAVFVVTLSTASGRPVSATYATSDRTAVAGSDYVSSTGTVNFAVGETAQAIRVGVMGDEIKEGDESFAVTLTNATNATITPAEAIGTITDDDAAPLALPDAPTIGQARAGNGTVSVAFTAPANPGSSPITGYTATCGARSGSGPASPITVSGLTNGTAVTCTVVATNAHGNSVPSGASNTVTPSTVPDAPIMGRATAGNGTVTVAFDPPVSNGGSGITGYTATCGARSASGPASPITVSGLANRRAVTCTVLATNANGDSASSATSNSVTPDFTGTAIPRLVNISTRGRVGTGDNILIGGFVVGGDAPKKVIIKGRGPSMAALGVPGTLSDPAIRLYSGSTAIEFNDDWQAAANVADITASGQAPTDRKESAILTTVRPGVPYTVHVTGVGETSGIAIVEVFELDAPEAPLLNISTRGPVQTGDNVMIGGFVIQGDAAQEVLVVAKGPSLGAAPFNVPGALSDPMLELYQAGVANPIETNDNWVSSANMAAIQSSGNAPTNPQESAILRTLSPGAYTAIVKGVSGVQGVGLVEVYRK